MNALNIQIFETLATIAETIVFLYMGMGVFTDRYNSWSPKFALYALLFCLLGRALNIVPLSYHYRFYAIAFEIDNLPKYHQKCNLFSGLPGCVEQ